VRSVNESVLPADPKYGLLARVPDASIRPSSRAHHTHPVSSRPVHGGPICTERILIEGIQPMSSMAANELGPMLTASEVAQMLHLHVNTVKRLGDRGELPFYRVCKRGDRRFRLDDVMAFLARNTKQ
jgi:excisionase family DNA binding protein